MIPVNALTTTKSLVCLTVVALIIFLVAKPDRMPPRSFVDGGHDSFSQPLFEETPSTPALMSAMIHTPLNEASHHIAEGVGTAIIETPLSPIGDTESESGEEEEDRTFPDASPFAAPSPASHFTVESDMDDIEGSVLESDASSSSAAADYSPHHCSGDPCCTVARIESGRRSFQALLNNAVAILQHMDTVPTSAWVTALSYLGVVSTPRTIRSPLQGGEIVSLPPKVIELYLVSFQNFQRFVMDNEALTERLRLVVGEMRSWIDVEDELESRRGTELVACARFAIEDTATPVVWCQAMDLVKQPAVVSRRPRVDDVDDEEESGPARKQSHSDL